MFVINPSTTTSAPNVAVVNVDVARSHDDYSSVPLDVIQATSEMCIEPAEQPPRPAAANPPLRTVKSEVYFICTILSLLQFMECV